jgi:hypothetical protein
MNIFHWKIPWAAIVPSLCLILVAVVQIYLARVANLAPWKGGGFGMFSTTDRTSDRQMRILITTLERTEELELVGKLKKLGNRVRAFPSEYFLKILAETIVQEMQSGGLPVDKVEIEISRIEYRQNDLKPHYINICRFDYAPPTDRMD